MKVDKFEDEIKKYIETTKAVIFVKHIQEHLDNNDVGSKACMITPKTVGCTICGKDIDKIFYDKLLFVTNLSKDSEDKK